ncbi:MAG: hypothetical protein RMY64_19405 [Nostoc sp. DedQUE08]|uniref:hypothetical protein n=1 Tax=unclassified Nostoc TaxID=2593658 RepID=UPI002AD40969|nr:MULTISPECIES: hypothetical protein [unclassified Nostoc]MDZ8067759.1 hypothetical protein [Nostoc sp. DedQUE08]MDZ8095930.1 hypothetical protein [Nostoc sp. DedQUE05]
MKVKYLIEKLQGFQPEAEIAIKDIDREEFFIRDIHQVTKLDKALNTTGFKVNIVITTDMEDEEEEED